MRFPRYAGVWRPALAGLVALTALLWSGASQHVLAAPAPVGIWKIYAPGWNLVAGPGGSRLGLHGETLYGLNGAVASYNEVRDQRARAGEGYWVFYPQGAMLLLVGTAKSISSVHVNAGNWALLGNSGTTPAAVRGADIALVYDPNGGFSPARSVQPGQAAIVYAYEDSDVFMDPYASAAAVPPVIPSQSPPALVPALPTAQRVSGSNGPASAATPVDELNYIYALSPILSDVDLQLGHFADNVGLADPTVPSAPVWQALRDDAAKVMQDLAALQALIPPARYTIVQADLVSALGDIADGISDTITGLLSGQPDRVTLGSGLLQSGARRLDTARGLLPQ